MMMAPRLGSIFWNETAKGIVVQKKTQKGLRFKKSWPERKITGDRSAHGVPAAAQEPTTVDQPP
jgi:hypothetical protein